MIGDGKKVIYHIEQKNKPQREIQGNESGTNSHDNIYINITPKTNT